MNFLWLFLLQEAAPQPSLLDVLMPFGLVFVIFWFLLIRPQRMADRERQAKISGLKKGDQIITSGGIIGKIENPNAKDNRVTVRIDDKAKITVLRSAIMEVIPKESSNKK